MSTRALARSHGVTRGRRDESGGVSEWSTGCAAKRTKKREEAYLTSGGGGEFRTQADSGVDPTHWDARRRSAGVADGVSIDEEGDARTHLGAGKGVASTAPRAFVAP